MEMARREQVAVVLEPPTAPSMVPIKMQTTIEEVRATDMVIALPIHEGSTRQLVSGEALRISFTVRPFGHVFAKTRVLGRLKMTSGNGTSFFGYRLALPAAIRRADRRRGERATLGFELSREAEFYKLDDQTSIRGVVQNVSTTGMQVRTHDTKPLLTQGERIRLVVYLPSPVGEVNRMVTITRVSVDRNPRFRLVAIAFDRELEGITDLIEGLQKQRDSKRKAG